VKCDGASFGGGAGYNAVDITDAAAIDALAIGLDDSLIYGTGLNLAGSGASRKLSIHLGGSALNDPTESLPHYVDQSYGKPNVETIPRGDKLTLKLAAYDRATKKSRIIEHTFTSCTRTRP
jgi:hypothetical protein